MFANCKNIVGPSQQDTSVYWHIYIYMYVCVCFCIIHRLPLYKLSRNKRNKINIFFSQTWFKHLSLLILFVSFWVYQQVAKWKHTWIWSIESIMMMMLPWWRAESFSSQRGNSSKSLAGRISFAFSYFIKFWFVIA